MSPSLNHAYIQISLGAELRRLKKHSVFSELTLEIDKDYIPDICLYSKREINLLQDIPKMTEMPLACIEILSPTQTISELMDKFKVYFEAGVKSCWLVIPIARAVVVLSGPDKAETFATGEVVDNVLDIRLPIKDVFA